MAKKMYHTNYAVAVNWLENDYVLCNNIAEVDPTIWDNLRFDFEDEYGNEREIFQFFLTSASERDVDWLSEHFGLLFTYSELLDLYVLCVDHYGTNWSYVDWVCDFENAERALGEKK